MSIGHLVQERKEKINFQDGSEDGYFGFLISMIWAIFFIYKSPECFLPSFKSVGLLVKEKKQKVDWLDGSCGDHLGFPIESILAIVDL